MPENVVFAMRRAGLAAVVVLLAGLVAVLVTVLWAQFPGAAGANGWAYHSIPYAVLMRNLASERRPSVSGSRSGRCRSCWSPCDARKSWSA